MSNPDTFIEEVTDEVRRDRLFAVLRRYGWIAVLAVVLIVGGASYREWRKAQDTRAAQALGDAIMAALEAPEAQARVAALDRISDTGDAQAVVDLLAAAELMAGEDRAGAVARLEGLANAPDLSDDYRHLAVLKLVMLAGDDMPADERRALLAPLIAPGKPYRLLALEQLAYLEAGAGETGAALDHLNEIVAAAEATAGLRERAAQLIVALGGEPADES